MRDSRPSTTHSSTVSAYGLFVVAVAGGALSLGLLAGYDLTAFLMLVGVAAVTAVCFVGPKCRLVVSVVGALVVFQSNFTVLKYAYLGLAVLCFVLSIRYLCDADGVVRREFRVMIMASIGFGAYLAFTFLVSRSNDVSFDLWFRDVLSYLLLVILPFVGIAAGQQMTHRWNYGWLMVLGIVCSVGLTADWLQRRGVSSLPIGRFILSSTVIVALCFACAITMAGLLRGAWRALWAGTAVLIIVSVILSGSRTNLVLLLGFLGVIGATRVSRVAPAKAVALLGTAVVALTIATPVLAGLIVDDPGFLDERLTGALTALDGQVGRDPSFAQRQRSYVWTIEAFSAHPVFGTGPGYLYPVQDAPTERLSTLDTPIIVLAKFGVVGIAVILGFFLALYRILRTLRRLYGSSPFHTVARGWFVILVALTPFGPWLEDKGFGAAVALLLAGAMAYVPAAGKRAFADMTTPPGGPPRHVPPDRRDGPSEARQISNPAGVMPQEAA